MPCCTHCESYETCDDRVDCCQNCPYHDNGECTREQQIGAFSGEEEE